MRDFKLVIFKNFTARSGNIKENYVDRQADIHQIKCGKAMLRGRETIGLELKGALLSI